MSAASKKEAKTKKKKKASMHNNWDGQAGRQAGRPLDHDYETGKKVNSGWLSVLLTCIYDLGMEGSGEETHIQREIMAYKFWGPLFGI